MIRPYLIYLLVLSCFIQIPLSASKTNPKAGPTIKRKSHKSATPTNIKILLFEGSKQKLAFILKGLKFYDNQVSLKGKNIPKINGKHIFKTSKPLEIKGNFYSGLFAIITKSRSCQLIQLLPLEDYLGGVLAGEISHSWPLESMKVQAVAARTYAYWVMKNSKKKPYHIKSGTSHQVFKGNERIHPDFKKALASTKGMILAHRGEPIQTFFTATCGGETEKPKYVWPTGKNFPYFQSVRCPYCKGHPKYKWSNKLPVKKIEQKLAKLNIGKIRHLRINKHSPSKRALEIYIRGSKKNMVLSGNKFRLAVGGTVISSLKFKLTKKGNYYHFRGTGYGHGVGLCQWGAKTMADKGYSYRRILQFYYKQARLKKL